jgi:hypothetical protein
MREKTFDAVRMKEELERRAEAELAGLPPAERAERLEQSVASGPLGGWWKGLRRVPPPARGRAVER